MISLKRLGLQAIIDLQHKSLIVKTLGDPRLISAPFYSLLSRLPTKPDIRVVTCCSNSTSVGLTTISKRVDFFPRVLCSTSVFAARLKIFSLLYARRLTIHSLYFKLYETSPIAENAGKRASSLNYLCTSFTSNSLQFFGHKALLISTAVATIPREASQPFSIPSESNLTSVVTTPPLATTANLSFAKSASISPFLDTSHSYAHPRSSWPAQLATTSGTVFSSSTCARGNHCHFNLTLRITFLRKPTVTTHLSALQPFLTAPFHRPVHTCVLAMAKSKFEYVKQFETDDPCLQNCWIVVRIDGKAFHKFTQAHHFMKPNDERGLSLMTRAAQTVMEDFNEMVLAYGQSDEYSFVFHKNCKLYNRRASKIMTNVVSLFASAFTLYWPRFFNTQELQYPPSFDARVVLYPSDENLKDYLSWRQADCHINNLYNTCFWKLVQEKGLTPAQSQDRLKGTLSSDKNELLFSEFNTNYNTLPELYRKGSVLIRPRDSESPSPEKGITNNARGYSAHAQNKTTKKPSSIVLHTDIIGKKFWEDHPHILNPKIC